MPGFKRHAGHGTMLLLAGVLAAGALVTAGCGGGDELSGPRPAATPEEETTVDPTTAISVAAFGCGQPFAPSGVGRLALVGRFPATVAAGEGMVAGTVEVTSREAVQGVVAPRAEVFLVRDGRVVTEPAAQDSIGIRWELAAGDVRSMPGEAVLVSCEPGGGAVPPGTYELYARVVVNPDAGAGVESFGGPWPLRVR